LVIIPEHARSLNPKTLLKGEQQAEAEDLQRLLEARGLQ
jgi:hypothetical protein